MNTTPETLVFSRRDFSQLILAFATLFGFAGSSRAGLDTQVKSRVRRKRVAGIATLDDAAAVKIAIRLPCCGAFQDRRGQEDKFPPVDCPKFRRKTPEEAEEEKRQMDVAMARVLKCFPWIAEMKNKYPHGTTGASDKCPVCGEKICFSIAGRNMHMRAVCATDECVNFIE